MPTGVHPLPRPAEACVGGLRSSAGVMSFGDQPAPRVMAGSLVRYTCAVRIPGLAGRACRTQLGAVVPRCRCLHAPYCVLSGENISALSALGPGWGERRRPAGSGLPCKPVPFALRLTSGGLRPVGVCAAANVEHGDDPAGTVDAVSDSVAAASGDPLPGEWCSQRLAESVGVVAKWAVDEFPCRGGHRHGKFIGQRSARWAGELDVVSHSVLSSRCIRAASSLPMSSPLVTSPASRDSSASVRRC